MSAFSQLPLDVVTDIVLRSFQLDCTISDICTVCRAWQSIVSQNLGQILLDKFYGDMPNALAHAVQHGELDVAYWLVSRAASLEDSNRAMLQVAAEGQTDLARLLLTAPQHSAHADYCDGEALVNAARNGHCEIVGMLLDAPLHAAHADSQDGTALLDAAGNGHSQVVRMLLDAQQHAPHADCIDGWALVDAAGNGHSEVVRMLLDVPQNAARADCLDGGALVNAAVKGHSEIVRMLLDAPQHAAHADCLGGVALVNAAANGHSEVVRMLLDAPNHAAHADCENGAALLNAVRNCQTEVVRILLNAPQHAAHADCQYGWALVNAAVHGRSEIVGMLLDAPQHAPHADCQDGQALVHAARNGRIEMVYRLLNAPQHAPHADCLDGQALVDAAMNGHYDYAMPQAKVKEGRVVIYPLTDGGTQMYLDVEWDPEEFGSTSAVTWEAPLSRAAQCCHQQETRSQGCMPVISASLQRLHHREVVKPLGAPATTPADAELDAPHTEEADNGSEAPTTKRKRLATAVLGLPMDPSIFKVVLGSDTNECKACSFAEGRRRDNRQVPASVDVYEFIVFKASPYLRFASSSYILRGQDPKEPSEYEDL
eukprot:gene28921-biopygen32803